MPGSAKSLATFNHLRIMLSMWIHCVPLLQADPPDSLTCELHGKHYVNKLPLPSSSTQLHITSAPNVTIQAIHSRPSIQSEVTSDSSKLLPAHHKQFTANVLNSLRFVYGSLTPHRISSVHSRERLASSDSYSQHTRGLSPLRF